MMSDEFGHEVSISDNGNIVAISSLKNPGALDTTSQSAGHVRVFQYTDDGWDQLENDIDGTVKDSRFGDVISLQDDGKKIIVLSDEDEGLMAQSIRLQDSKNLYPEVYDSNLVPHI